MGRRRRTVRVLGIAEGRRARRGRVVTEIAPGDHCRLHLLLLAKPAEVLRLFAALQIVCLAQMEGWMALKAEHPAEAARIVAVAALMGIPEGVDGENGTDETDETDKIDGTDGEGCSLWPQEC